jgi:hypothetical protein
MPGSSTTPGHPGTRAHAPVCIAFHLRKSVGTREMNLYGAQWLAYVLPYRRFVVVLTGDYARLGANVDRYSFIASDLHRLLVAGLPAHCENFWTLRDHVVGANQDAGGQLEAEHLGGLVALARLLPDIAHKPTASAGNRADQALPLPAVVDRAPDRSRRCR